MCKNAFISIYGVTRGKVDYLLSNMKKTGQPHVDSRGKHHNRSHKLSNETVETIRNHIKSFKGRGSHYSLANTKKVYLSDDLNISKMFSLFKKSHPNTATVSYESYRTVFNRDFNLSSQNLYFITHQQLSGWRSCSWLFPDRCSPRTSKHRRPIPSCCGPLAGKTSCPRAAGRDGTARPGEPSAPSTRL